MQGARATYLCTASATGPFQSLTCSQPISLLETSIVDCLVPQREDFKLAERKLTASAPLAWDFTVIGTGAEVEFESEFPRPFVCLHIGDLHITQPPSYAPAGNPNEPCPRPMAEIPDESNARSERERRLESDLAAILADIELIRDKSVYDFVFLPGDLAENACAAEYKVLSDLLAAHPEMVVRLIPGDHDRARRNLDDFAAFRHQIGVVAPVKHEQGTPVRSCYEVPFTNCPVPPNPLRDKVTQFYFSEVHNEVVCIFLDLVSASRTAKVLPGLDFRLGHDQLEWLSDTLHTAKTANKKCAVFMHCYPHDMRDDGEKASVAGLIWSFGVKLVEMGHTHYNEICHDGRTQYATARSVGQNEDGPTGYAVVAIDGPVTSWRFKQLQLTWPFVMITSPADRRLATGPLKPFYVASDGGSIRQIIVRALVLTDHPNVLCQCSVDDGRWIKMQFVGNAMFQITVDWPVGSKKVSVQASDARGSFKDFVDLDTIEPVAEDFKPQVPTKRLGSDEFAIGVWHEKGVRGDQLGPNTSGHQW